MTDVVFMREAVRLARKGLGATSPNPMVGALLVRSGRVIGRGWHRQAGGAHAEIEALRDAGARGHSPKGATLYVTLEPCCTHGRTPPCTEAIIAAGIQRVVVGATDPNPRHAGRGFKLLQRAGIEVVSGVLAAECMELNEVFNHWIVRGTPFVTVKSAMTLDGKIATAAGESKWITGAVARAAGMKLRGTSDAILVGVNTVLADDPSLTFRPVGKAKPGAGTLRPLRRLILDTLARTPLSAKVVSDERAAWTTIVVGRTAPPRRVAALRRQVNVLIAPLKNGSIDLGWLLKRLGKELVTSLLVEGGGEVNASFLLEDRAQRVVFFYAPKILGGRESRRAVGGEGAKKLSQAPVVRDVVWRRAGEDLWLTGRVDRER